MPSISCVPSSSSIAAPNARLTLKVGNGAVMEYKDAKGAADQIVDRLVGYP